MQKRHVPVLRQNCQDLRDQWPVNSVFIFYRHGRARARARYKKYVRERDRRALNTNQSLIT